MAEEEKDEGFTSKQFLEMPEANQKFWLLGAITALSQVTAARNKQAGQCVYDWYFNDKTPEINWLIFESMKQNPQAEPVAILMFLSQRECGIYWE